MFRLIAATALLALASPAFADDKDKPKPNTLTPKEIADGWILLFDGETTFGWTTLQPPPKGEKPEMVVKDGCLVIKGKDVGLWSTTHFEELELSAEYRASGKSNSIGFGWFANQDKPTPFVRVGLKKDSEWHSVAMQSRRDGFQIAVDGKEATSATGVKIQRPAIAIRFGSQDDGGETHLELRNVKLRPLNTKPLFTGENLNGWKINAADPKRMASKWEVTNDGELSVKNGPGDLVTEKEYANFVLQFECKTLGKALNSGFFFRCIPGQYQNGYEAQIQNAYKDDDRTKPADFGTGAIYRRVPARKVVSNDNEWFTMTVVADGKHIATWVNGYQTVDWIDERKENDNPRNGYRSAKGPISIQGHDPTTDILFRNIRVAELPAEKK